MSSDDSKPLPSPEDLLPHRPPFLFVDALTALQPGETASATWTLTGDEAFFTGHFPGRPTLPGVLIIEALAQVGACVVLSDERHAGKIPLFGGADKIKFRRQVVPGDKLELDVTMDRVGSRAGRGSGVARIDGEVAAQGSLLFVLIDGVADDEQV